MGTLEDIANVVEFFVWDLSSLVSGQHLLVSWGHWHDLFVASFKENEITINPGF